MTNIAPGTYTFTTATGSAYTLAVPMDAATTLTRHPGKHNVHPSMDGHETAPLRRDAHVIPVLSVRCLALNEPAVFILDLRGDLVPTQRTTSELVTLEHSPN